VTLEQRIEALERKLTLVEAIQNEQINAEIMHDLQLLGCSFKSVEEVDTWLQRELEKGNRGEAMHAMIEKALAQANES
jgi:hypothetical protein